MKVKLLQAQWSFLEGAPPQPPERPGCQAVVSPGQLTDHLVRWRKDRYGPANYALCRHTATVEIDGKYYCMKHGGKIALLHLVEESCKDDTTAKIRRNLVQSVPKRGVKKSSQRS